MLDFLYQAAQAIVLIAGIATIVGALIVKPIFGRAQIEVSPKQWKASGPVPWSFATVDVTNSPLPWWLSWLMKRETVVDARVRIEFRRLGDPSLALPIVDGRWSDKPEPIRVTGLQQHAAGAVSFVGAPAPELVLDSQILSLLPGPDRHEVAVAVIHADGTAYAWGAESYLYPQWRRPEWALTNGEYDVTIRVTGRRKPARYRLRYLSADFAAFTLHPAAR